MEWALCSATILTDFRAIDWQGFLPWTASSTNMWVYQSIFPCQRLGCMQGTLCYNGQLLVQTLLAEYSYVGGWGFGSLVLFMFLLLYLDIQSLAHLSALQQLEIS